MLHAMYVSPQVVVCIHKCEYMGEYMGTIHSKEILSLSHFQTVDTGHVALFPGLSRFRSSVCVQYNTRKQKSAKNAEGLGTPIL